MMLAVSLYAMHIQHEKALSQLPEASINALPIERVSTLFPSASRWGNMNRRGGIEVLDFSGAVIGSIIQTSPASDRFLGFSGPTNVWIAFDSAEKVIGIEVIDSRDTHEHVELVKRDASFQNAWNAMTWEQAANAKIDGVAGATLTSLAIVQGIQKRLGNVFPIAKFTYDLTLQDAQTIFPAASKIQRDETFPALFHLLDAKAKNVGVVLFTSPEADEIIGYQGPTNARIAIDLRGELVNVQILESFDNEPYTRYVRNDAYFAKLLRRYSIEQWNAMELKQSDIEGVSGATMTSMAVAEGIIATAREYKEHIDAPKRKELTAWLVKTSDLGTLLIIAIGFIIGMTGLRGNARLRVVFQVVLVVYLGLINGHLLSLAMLVGWSQSGIPWTTAVGLVALSIAAVATPIFSQRNIYCSHLCPHGAVQQLLPRRWKLAGQLSRKWRTILLSIRPLLIGWALLVGLLQLPISLVNIEPFDAYSWRAAAWGSIAVAITGLLVSLRIPMAYCRYGCPTGALLQYVRRHSRSDRWCKADSLALSCSVIGLLALA